MNNMNADSLDVPVPVEGWEREALRLRDECARLGKRVGLSLGMDLAAAGEQTEALARLVVCDPAAARKRAVAFLMSRGIDAAALPRVAAHDGNGDR